MPPCTPHGVTQTKPNFAGRDGSIFKSAVPPTKVVNTFKVSLISAVIEDALPPMGTSFVSRHIKSASGYFGISFEIIPLGSCFDHAY